MRTIRRCAETFGKANPWPDLIELTSKLQYTAGIPCVDAAGGSAGKIQTYERLSVAMRGGLFGALLFAAYPAHTEVRVFVSAGYVYVPALILALLATLCWWRPDGPTLRGVRPSGRSARCSGA